MKQPAESPRFSSRDGWRDHRKRRFRPNQSSLFMTGKARWHSRLLAVVFIGLVLVLSSQRSLLISQLWSNIGWLKLAHAMLAGDVAAAHIGDLPADYFGKAIQASRSNLRAYLGAGMAYAEILDEANALDAWQRGDIDPVLLNELGRKLGWIRHSLLIVRHSACASRILEEGSSLAERICQQI